MHYIKGISLEYEVPFLMKDVECPWMTVVSTRLTKTFGGG